MNRLRLLKIATPLIGVAAVGSIGGAVGYYFYKTAPEKWNNALQEFREVHLGFDGNQMIGYLATGQYEDTLAAQTAKQSSQEYQAKSDHLIYGAEMEYHKVVYVKNLSKNSEAAANAVTKYELNFGDREKSIIKTLAGKQGDQYQIVSRTEGITFRNNTIRENAFKYAPDITKFKDAKGNVDVKKYRDTVNKLSNQNYDDEDIKAYSKDAGALFKLDYMSGDVSMAGINGKVDTPTTSYVKSIDFDTIKKEGSAIGKLVEGAVQSKVILDKVNGDHKTGSILDAKKVVLTADQFSMMSANDHGNFMERNVDFVELAKAVKANKMTSIGAILTNTYLMPRAMVDVSPDTQLIDKKIYVTLDGNVDHAKFLGKLERYNNEFVVSDLSGIYKDAAAKTADAGHYGDLKITSWW